MQRANEHIRRAARAADVPFWKIAQYLGVSELTVTRWMRMPLPTDKEQRIKTAIDTLSQEAG